MLDRSVWALEASALALAAFAWVLAASAPYRSGRHVCDGAYRARCPPAGAIANALFAGLGQQEAALFQARLVKQARPLGVMAACHGVPESKTDGRSAGRRAESTLIDRGLTGVRG